jgi:hypothetical protein
MKNPDTHGSILPGRLILNSMVKIIYNELPAIGSSFFRHHPGCSFM